MFIYRVEEKTQMHSVRLSVEMSEHTHFCQTSDGVSSMTAFKLAWKLSYLSFFAKRPICSIKTEPEPQRQRHVGMIIGRIIAE